MENKTLGQIALAILFIWLLVVASFWINLVFYKVEHKTQIIQQTIERPVEVIQVKQIIEPQFENNCTKIEIDGQPNLFYCDSK